MTPTETLVLIYVVAVYLITGYAAGNIYITQEERRPSALVAFMIVLFWPVVAAFYLLYGIARLWIALPEIVGRLLFRKEVERQGKKFREDLP